MGRNKRRSCRIRLGPSSPRSRVVGERTGIKTGPELLHAVPVADIQPLPRALKSPSWNLEPAFGAGSPCSLNAIGRSQL